MILKTTTIFFTIISMMMTSVNAATDPKNIETQVQADPLSVEVSVKFPQSIRSVKQAINHLLLKSGYGLDNNYEAEKINDFNLPEVHRKIGPIPLIRAIKVLLGSAWVLQVDHVSRVIRIAQSEASTVQILNPDARTMLESVVSPDVLDEVVVVSIDDELIHIALLKILPGGWSVKFEDEALKKHAISVVSEDLKREEVINKALTIINARGYFYKKLKLLVVLDKAKIIQ